MKPTKKYKKFPVCIDGPTHLRLVDEKDRTGVPISEQIRRALDEKWDRDSKK